MEEKVSAHKTKLDTYSGWLYKEDNCHLSKKFCKIYQGYFLYFLHGTSKEADGYFSLSNYRAEPMLDRDSKKQDRYFFVLEHQGSPKKPSYAFAGCSTRDRKDWCSKITKVVENHRKNVYKKEVEDDDYDYAQLKPIDISFSNPENIEPMVHYEETSGNHQLQDNLFRGPTNLLLRSRNTIIAEKLSLPKPAPRRVLSTGDLSTVENTATNFRDVSDRATTSRPPKPYKELKKERFCPSPEPNRTSNEKVSQNMDHHRHTFPGAASANINHAEYFGNDEQNKKRYEYNEISQHEPRYSPATDRKEVADIHFTSAPPPPVPQRIPIAKPFSHPEIADHEVVPASIYQWNANRQDAEQMLAVHGIKGLYLIRNKTNERHVLTVFTAEKQKFRHYIIFQKCGQQSLAPEPAPRFDKIKDLLIYYMNNDLPTCKVKLSQPYK